jgi:transposase-like protein
VTACLALAGEGQLTPATPQEGRRKKEVRSRTGVAGILSDRDAIIRLVSAVLAGQNDEWTEGRRYIGPGIPRRLRESRNQRDWRDY